MKSARKKTDKDVLEYPNKKPRRPVSISPLDRFCGAWKDERSAEEIVQDIYSKRSWTSGDQGN
jgi:hypothetical protein